MITALIRLYPLYAIYCFFPANFVRKKIVEMIVELW